MAQSTPNTIVLTVNGNDRPIFEAEADEALTPGELVRFDADEELEPHGTAGGVLAGKKFVVENPYTDPADGPAIDKDWAVGDLTRYIEAQPGDEIYAFIAAGETIVKGVTQLVSDGAGALAAATVDATTLANSIVAVAMEDATIGGTRARKKVRIV